MVQTAMGQAAAQLVLIPRLLTGREMAQSSAMAATAAAHPQMKVLPAVLWLATRRVVNQELNQVLSQALKVLNQAVNQALNQALNQAPSPDQPPRLQAELAVPQVIPQAEHQAGY